METKMNDPQKDFDREMEAFHEALQYMSPSEVVEAWNDLDARHEAKMLEESEGE